VAKTLTWLQLSDLHSCRPRTGWDARRVLETLLVDLEWAEEEAGLSPDFLFFTGDLAFGHLGDGPGESLDEQLADAQVLIEGVRAAFSRPIPVERTFIVPGNHDVDRRQVMPMITQWLAGQSAGDLNQLLERKGPEWALIMKRLEGYRAFLQANGYDHLLGDPERLVYGVVEEVDDLRVGIGGLNSAWSCGPGEAKANLRFAGGWQLEQLKELLRASDLRIALCHHPPNWFGESEDAALWSRIERDFDFFLHGHEHQGWVKTVDDGHVRIAAGACYDRSDAENGYNFVRLDLDAGRGEVWLRRYDPTGGGWTEREVARTTDSGRWPLPRLRLQPRKKAAAAGAARGARAKGRKPPSRLRACFISSEYPPHVYGGLGVHVQNLTASLVPLADLDVVLPSSGREGYVSTDPRIALHSLGNAYATYDNPVSWLRFAKLAAARVGRLARQGRPDVLHCHDWVTVLAGVKCRWALGTPLLFHLHLPNRRRLCASVENLGLVCADLVTVNSEAMHDELTDRGLPLQCRIEVVKNGVDLDAFHPADDWPADEGYLLFVGRLVQQKGLEVLLSALQYVRAAFPDVRLKVAGDGELLPALESYCTSRMLGDHVEFLGWKVGDELVGLYQKAAVVVVPSIYEPFGMTVLEALACQRPVVASRVGGLKEVVRHETTGYLAEPRDDLDLAQWLMSLLASADRRRAMGRAGRAFVGDQRFTWPEIAAEYLKLYEEVACRSVDLHVPKRAFEFRDQIEGVAQELAPELGEPSNNTLAELFDWMTEP
jgi:glycosyltransferase involved in cell wall biosynthesis